MMQFAGKDFLKMQAPAGYKAGVGRGAVGFTTSAERGAAQFPLPNSKRAKPNTAKPSNSGDRFLDAEDEEASRIFDEIEAKRKSKRKNPSRNLLNIDTINDKHTNEADNSLKSISIDEWASIPEAEDTTRWNKRLRESEQSTQRMYVPPPTTSALTDDTSEVLLAESKRPLLEAMVKQQPLNPEGYLQLAKLEEQMMHIKRARNIINQGTKKVPYSEKLWIESINLHFEKLSEARSIAERACQALPHSETLWLKAIDCEPTVMRKQQTIHEALLSCPNSEQLWLQAAECESQVYLKRDILQTAKQFVATPKIYIALSALNTEDKGVYLTEARSKFPNHQDVWFESIKHDNSLVDEAISNLSRDKWMEFIKLNSETFPELITKIVQQVKVDLTEISSLPVSTQLSVFKSMEPTLELYLAWSRLDPNILDRAVTEFSSSDMIWKQYFYHRALKDDSCWQVLLNTKLSASLVMDIAQSLQDQIKNNNNTKKTTTSTTTIDMLHTWLKLHKSDSPALRLMYIQQLDTPPIDLIDESLKEWPGCVDFYILKASMVSAPAVYLRKAINSDQIASADKALLWNELANYETVIPKKRAILTQAVAKYPDCAPLWFSRVQLEQQENKPVGHTLSEALRRCPTYGPLWKAELLNTPVSQRKRRLAEAVRQSHGSPEVLYYGALYFAAANNLKAAKEWLAKARLGSETDLFNNNPFLTGGSR